MLSIQFVPRMQRLHHKQYVNNIRLFDSVFICMNYANRARICIAK